MTAFRYRDVEFWKFFQDDSVSFLKNCLEWIKRADLIFIDTIHSYEHTMEELRYSCRLSDNILLDDATFEGNDFDDEPGGVKKAIEDWIYQFPEWKRSDYGNGTVCFITKM